MKGKNQKMASTVAFSKELEAPVDMVWHLITDTRTWPRWGPSVLAVDSPERYIRAGLAGRIRTPIGLWLPFTIETFEPYRYWDWRVGGLAATGHHVEAIAKDRCRLDFTVPIWAFGYGIVCRLALNRIQRLVV
jgi:hypothetical protein